MPLAGKQLLPREIAAEGHRHWTGNDLVKMVATCLGESAGFVGAWHDNTDEDGNVLSRDLGLMQINRPGRTVGTPEEFTLRTESKTRAEYAPVVGTNVDEAVKLYLQPGPNTGYRRWQPWVAYTTGWATFPAWWVWHHDARGKAVGPWLPTGRYLQKAIAGVANMHLLITKDMDGIQAVALARSRARYFGVADAVPAIRNGVVAWDMVPQKPYAPPRDGEGPRPRPNDGA